MARILRSDMSRGFIPVVSTFKYGDSIAMRASYAMNATDGNIVAATDLIEMLPLLEGCVVTFWRINTEGTLTAETVGVGLIDGEWQSTSSSRAPAGTAWATAYDATIVNGTGAPTVSAPYLLDPTDAKRSIAIIGVGSDITMATTIKLTLTVIQSPMRARVTT